MDDWVDGRGRTFDRLRELGRVRVGTVVEVKRVSGTTAQLLIGDVNPLGGVCDDCVDLERSDVIIRYRQVWEPESA